MGLYMHAGWFYGEYSWHYEGYKDFLQVLIKLGLIFKPPYFYPTLKNKQFPRFFVKI